MANQRDSNRFIRSMSPLAVFSSALQSSETDLEGEWSAWAILNSCIEAVPTTLMTTDTYRVSLGIQHLLTISRSTAYRIQEAGRLCMRIQTFFLGRRGLSHHTTRFLTVHCRVNGPRHLSHFPLFCFTAKTVQTTLRTMFCLNSTLCCLRNEKTSASSSGVHSAPDTLCALVLGRFAGSLAESCWPSWYPFRNRSPMALWSRNCTNGMHLLATVQRSLLFLNITVPHSARSQHDYAEATMRNNVSPTLEARLCLDDSKKPRL